MPVIVETEGPVRIVTIDRPASRNAVDPDTARTLDAAFDAVERDPAIKLAVLTGAGGTFCAGYDLKSLAGKRLGSSYRPEGPGPMGPSRRLLAKPVIAAVEGHAVAGGLELALWCDLRVASETAVFGVFCRRWGVPLVDGGTVRLPRVIGHARAMDMILTGRPVGAREALDWGLANRVVPAGAARGAAVALAAEIARFPELCMLTDRASAHRQWSLSLDDALAMEAREGRAPLVAEAELGAARFAGGKGRGGDFEKI
jgi:enoyl-CoA hydratase